MDSQQQPFSDRSNRSLRMPGIDPFPRNVSGACCGREAFPRFEKEAVARSQGLFVNRTILFKRQCTRHPEQEFPLFSLN